MFLRHSIAFPEVSVTSECFLDSSSFLRTADPETSAVPGYEMYVMLSCINLAQLNGAIYISIAGNAE